MAVRQLHYCTHCGTPLVGLIGRAGGPEGTFKFCPSCGHRLYPVAPIIPRRPALRVAPPRAAIAGSKAPAGRRAAAAAVDLLLAGLAALVAWALGAEISVILNAGARAGHHGSVLAWALVAIVAIGYQPLFWARSGRTPGMHLLGLCLVSAAGSPVGAGRALARTAAMLVSALPLGLGFAGAWRDAEGRTWHDRLAGTQVVAPPKG